MISCARGPRSGLRTLVVLLSVFVAACGGQPIPVPSSATSPSSSRPPILPTTAVSAGPTPASAVPSTAVSPPSAGATATSAPEPGGSGEPAAVGEGGSTPPYTNTRFAYSVDVPGPMTEAADGSAAYESKGETLRIGVVTGSGAADPMAMARGDFGQAQREPGFKQISAPASVTITGRRVVKFVYQSLIGSNPVTGKPYRFTSVRYYIPGGADRLAVVAYAAFTVDWDPQNADDLETSFKWL